MKVGIATADWSESFFVEEDGYSMGGSGWIRLGQYLEHFSIDHVTGVLVWLPDSHVFGVQTWDRDYHRDCDVIVMQRWMDEAIIDEIGEARNEGQVIVQDIDDWYWGLSVHNKAFKVTHPKTNPTANINHYKKILARSDYVITSTPYLLGRLQKFVSKEKLILHMNYVNFEHFTQRTHTEADTPRIGWMGSTAHRSGDLKVVKGFATDLVGAFTFHHSGHYDGYPHYYNEIGVSKEHVSLTPMVIPRNLGAKSFGFDIGIVPLQDIPFNHAKSWIKGLEYVAAGIPFVASPLPEYVRLNEEYGIGRLAGSRKDWMRHLNELRDPELRQEEAAHQFEAAQPLDTHIGATVLENILIAAS